MEYFLQSIKKIRLVSIFRYFMRGEKCLKFNVNLVRKYFNFDLFLSIFMEKSASSF